MSTTLGLEPKLPSVRTHDDIARYQKNPAKERGREGFDVKMKNTMIAIESQSANLFALSLLPYFVSIPLSKSTISPLVPQLGSAFSVVLYILLRRSVSLSHTHASTTPTHTQPKLRNILCVSSHHTIIITKHHHHRHTNP